MKNICKLVIATLTCGWLLSGCELERKDFEKINPDNFYKNESDCKAALAALYGKFTEGPWGSYFGQDEGSFIVFTEMTTDIMNCTWGDYGSWAKLNEHTWTAANNIPYDKFVLYKDISTARNVIRAIEQAPVSDNVKKELIAEAKLIRGWRAYLLYDSYGPVPVASDKMLDNPQEDFYPERMSRADFVKFIVEEINSAIPDLKDPSEQGDADFGRVNKGIAYMVLMKLYMVEKDFAKMKEFAEKIKALNYYELQNSYASVFSISNKRNKEIIYAAPCSYSFNGNAWHAHVLPGDYPTSIPYQKWGGYKVEWSFVHTYQSQDERLKTMLISYTDKNGILIKEGVGRLVFGAIPMKYDLDPNQVGENSAHDMIIFRYADVLLALAESINELSGPSSEAYSFINEIRTRSKVLPMTEGLTKAQFRDSVLLERGHELYCEGSRRADLIRHGKYIEYARLVPNNQTADYKVLFPIPNEYILEFKNALKQNDGY